MNEAQRQRIEQEAYYRAERRGFAPGHELEDWLAAERELLAQESRKPGSGDTAGEPTQSADPAADGEGATLGGAGRGPGGRSRGKSSSPL
jgi:hypothetical protein